MTFLYPQLLFFIIPALLLTLLIRQKTASHPFHPAIVLRSATNRSKLLPLLLILLVVALARPVIELPHQERTKTGTLFIALDLSASMQARDIEPNRLQAAKRAMEKLIHHSHLYIGLIAFTSNPIIIAPPTHDRRVLELALEAIEPKNILTKSTDIQKVLDFASRFGERVNLAIVSDGGDAKTFTKPSNITLFAVRAATPSGALIPTQEGYLKHEGRLVVSKLNPTFVHIADHVYDLDEIEEIPRTIQTQSQKIERKRFIEFYPFILAFAALLVLFIHTRLFDGLKRLIPLVLVTSLHASLWEEMAIQKGYELYKEGHYAKSVDIFVELPYFEARYALAKSFMKLGKFDRALKILQDLKSSDKKKKAKIFLNVGVCYEKLRRYDKARLAYAKAAALGEKSALFHLEKIVFAKNPKKPLLPFSKQKKIQAKSKGNGKKSGGSSNMQTALLAGNAKGGKKKRAQNAVIKGKGMPLSSKVYEIINKGYIHEKNPW